MDPLLLEALRFGVAIIAGGIVAVIAQRIAFRNTQQLQREERLRHDARLRRALVAEIRENLVRIGGPTVTGVPGGRVVRAAWDAAHAIPLSPEIFDSLALAYRHAAELERGADFMMGRIQFRGIAQRWFPEWRARQQIEEVTRQHAKATYDAFARALQLLEPREHEARAGVDLPRGT